MEVLPGKKKDLFIIYKITYHLLFIYKLYEKLLIFL